MVNFTAFNQGVAQGAGAVNDAQRDRLKARQARQDAAQKEAESLAGQYNKKAQGDLYSAQARETDAKTRELQFELKRTQERVERQEQVNYNNFVKEAFDSRHYGKIAQIMKYDPERTQALLAEKGYASLPQPLDFVADHQLLIDAGMPEASLNPNDPNTGKVRAYAAKNLFKVLKTDGTYEINSFNNANMALGFNNMRLKSDIEADLKAEADWANAVDKFSPEEVDARIDKTKAETEEIRAKIGGNLKNTGLRSQQELDAANKAENDAVLEVQKLYPEVQSMADIDFADPKTRKAIQPFVEATMHHLGIDTSLAENKDIRTSAKIAHLYDLASRLPPEQVGFFNNAKALLQQYSGYGELGVKERSAFQSALNAQISRLSGAAVSAQEFARNIAESGSLWQNHSVVLAKIGLQAGSLQQELRSVLDTSKNRFVASYQLGVPLDSIDATVARLSEAGDSVPVNDKADREAWKITNPGEPYPGDE